MGVAALMIIILHAHWDAPFRLWNYIFNNYGSLGVDFFVFTAGFGCAFSLRRDADAGRFFHRRLRRLLPVFYLSIAVFVLLAGMPPVVDLVQRIIPVGVWFGNGGTYWYVGATILYYLLVPPMYGAIRHSRWPRLAALLLLIAFSTLVPIATRDSAATVALMRLPALVMGVALGAFDERHRSRRDWLLNALLFAGVFAAGVLMTKHRAILGWGPFGYLSHHQCARLPRALFAPGLALLLAAGLELIEKTPLRFVNRVLSLAGRRSLELYMSHVIVRYVCYKYLGLSEMWRLVMMLIFSYPLAAALDWVSKRLLALVERVPLFRAPARTSGAGTDGSGR